MTEISSFIPLIERLGSFALLAIIIIYAIAKLVPYAFKYFGEKITEMNAENNKTVEKMQNEYLASINKISDTQRTELRNIAENFQKSVENSTNWHQKHSQDMEEIKNLLIGKRPPGFNHYAKK